jgi:hypothetical protein
LPADWRSLARTAGFRVSAVDTVTVDLDGGSSQLISFEVSADSHSLRAHAIVAKPSVVAVAAGDDGPLRYAWERNRLCDLVGFTTDKHGRLIAETWIPLEALTAEEIGVYVNELARISDWHEFRLTGEDVY